MCVRTVFFDRYSRPAIASLVIPDTKQHRTSFSRLVKVARSNSCTARSWRADFSSASTRVSNHGGIHVSPRNVPWITVSRCSTDWSFGTHPQIKQDDVDATFSEHRSRLLNRCHRECSYSRLGVESGRQSLGEGAVIVYDEELLARRSAGGP